MWEKFTTSFSNLHTCFRMSNSFILPKKQVQSGFSLMELMIATGIVSILAGVAIPSYINFTKNGDISSALSTLINLSTQMEKAYLDNGSYNANSGCSVAAPASDTYTFSCSSSDANQYTWKTTSTDGDYEYTISQNGNRATTKFKGGSTPENGTDCWLISDRGECF